MKLPWQCLPVREDARVSCFSILRKHAASVSSHRYVRRNYTRERFFSTLDLPTAIEQKNHVGLLLDLSAKGTGIEFNVYKHACAGKLLELTATKHKGHV